MKKLINNTSYSAKHIAKKFLTGLVLANLAILFSCSTTTNVVRQQADEAVQKKNKIVKTQRQKAKDAQAELQNILGN